MENNLSQISYSAENVEKVYNKKKSHVNFAPFPDF